MLQQCLRGRLTARAKKCEGHLLVLITSCLAALGFTAAAQPGSLDSSFDPGLGANNEIFALAAQGDGKLIIGGSFTSFNGTNQNRVARLNVDGTLDDSFSTGIGANGTVSNISILPDDRIVLSGSFTSFNGTNRFKVARLNADGTLDESFNSFAFTSNISGEIKTVLAVQKDGRVLGSSLTGFNGSGLSLWRLDEAGNIDRSFDGFSLSFQEMGGGLPSFYVLTARQTDDEKLLVGGDFFARFHRHGSLDTAFASGVNTNRGVRGFAFLNDGRVLIAATNGPETTRICRLNHDGAMDASYLIQTAFVNHNNFLPPETAVTTIVALPDGKALVGGGFTNLNGTLCNRIARLNSDGSIDSTFSSGIGANSQINAMITTTTGGLLIAGRFTNYNGVIRNRIARLNGDSPSVPSFVAISADQTSAVGRTPFLFAEVAGGPSLAYQWRFNGAVIEGATNAVLRLPNAQLSNNGQFSVQASNEVTLVVSTGINLAIQRAPVQPGSVDVALLTDSPADSTVRCLTVLTNGKILVAGQFTKIGGFVRPRLARLNPDWTVDSTFDAGTGPNATVHALALQVDGKLLIGGDFSSVNGSSWAGLARLNPDGTLDTSFASNQFSRNATTSGSVYAIGLDSDGKIFVGGQFSRVNASFRSSFARFLTNGILDSFTVGSYVEIHAILSLNPSRFILAGVSGSSSSSAFVARYFNSGSLTLQEVMDSIPGGGVSAYSLVLQPDGKLLVGGNFQYGMIRYQTNGHLDANFNAGWPTAFSSVRSIGVQPDGRLLVAGDFTKFKGVSRRHVVRLNSDGTTDTSFDAGGGPDGTVHSIVSLTNGSCLIGGAFTSVDGCERCGLARLNGELRVLSSGKTGDVFAATVMTDLGKNYILQFKDALSDSNWSSLQAVAGEGALQALWDATANVAQRFYRVRVE